MNSGTWEKRGGAHTTGLGMEDVFWDCLSA